MINEFDAKTPPSRMDFSFSPMWVQIHDMLLGCMSRGIGAKIGSILGNVEDVAVPADDVGWGCSLRVRVSLNLYQPLDWGRELLLSSSSCWVSFRYEKLPCFCYQCGCILHKSHKTTGCSTKATTKSNHNE